MADRKPPRCTGDERITSRALLQYQRESFLGKVEDLTDGDASRQFVASGTSLLWLLQHLAHAEQLWFVQRFAGRDLATLPAAAQPDGSVAGAARAYRATWHLVDEIVAGASFDDLCADTGVESPVNLRWVVSHLLEETARHAGHADILRELIDGRTGR
jgi:uncharacterized damage-inducible protein DinB